MTQTEKQTSSTYTFSDLNQDLNDLYEVLKQENFKNHEIQQLIDPITSKIPDNHVKTGKIFTSANKAILIMLSVIVTIYLFTYWNTFYWNLTALTRICMIKILPYFDWRPLKNEACLVRRFFDHADQKIPTEEIFNCDLCESLTSVEQITHDLDGDIEDLIQKFIDIDRPVVVKGGIEHWVTKSPGDFVDRLINEKELSRSIPCKLSTNIHNLRKDDVDLRTLIKKSGHFNSFFMHFQNCEVEAVKIFRKYTYRPKVLPAELSPVTYNWLLWSRRHNATRFKKIDLVEKYTAIGQIFGNTRLKLVPRKNCKEVCPVIDEILPAAGFLVLTSLWDVEYLPDGRGENLAAILEVKG